MTDERAGSVFRSPAHRRRALLVAGGLLGTVAAATAGVWLLDPGVLAPARIRVVLEATGPAAPVAFVALQAMQVVVAPIPGQLLAGVGGYLFGGPLGLLYSMLGVTLGSTVVFAASRRYGRPFATRVLDPAALARFDGFVADSGSAGLFVAFLLPAFPDDALCLLAGLTALRYRRFLLLLIVGRTPTFVASAVAGTSIATDRFDRALLVVAGLTVAMIAVYRFRSRLIGALRRLTG